MKEDDFTTNWDWMQTLAGRIREDRLDDLLEVARVYNVKGAAAAFDKVEDTVADYRKYSEAAGVEPRWEDRIRREIDARLRTANRI